MQTWHANTVTTTSPNNAPRYVGLSCLLDSRERFHNAAMEAYANARMWLTHNYVLDEFVALAQARRFDRVKTLSYLQDLLTDPDVQTVWVDALLHEQALNLLVRRPDKTYSLCDAVSFILMRQHGIQDALTTDHHFEQEGFNRLLKA